jgi:hypothetical protein
MDHLQHLISCPPRVRSQPAAVARLRRAREEWPEAALQAFSLRMADHGLSVSSTLMRCDPGYALQQLKQADELGDDGLRELASALFRDFQIRRAGVALAGQELPAPAGGDGRRARRPVPR